MKIHENFFTPIVFASQPKTFKQKVIEACDDFFYYGGRKITVFADKNTAISHTQKASITALKIALCFTIVLPALCLLGKALFRPTLPVVPHVDKLQALRMQIDRMTEEELNTYPLKNREHIQNRDLQRLFGTNWLNDTCIDEYMKLLIKDQPDFCLCSVMMVKLALERPEDRALNLARIRTHDGQKLTSLFDTPKKVLIPINTGLHWALMVFDTGAKIVHYYDSIAKEQLPESAKTICSQLEKLADSTLHVINLGHACPQQTNGSDCGIFTLLAASHVIQNKPLTYTQEDAPRMRAKILSDFCGF
ncbi:MAG: hypothetical protein LLF94_12305 [Chlamydiales bacterium]|nr:hypothetical protein [Chlamydiales bacterium]